MPKRRASYLTRSGTLKDGMSTSKYHNRSGTLKDGTISHKAFSQQVGDFAKLHGWMGYRTWNSVHSPAGFLDWVFVRPAGYIANTPTHREDLPDGDVMTVFDAPYPRLVIAELKCGRDKIRPSQQEWVDALRAAFISVYIWRPTPEDWAEIEQVLGYQL